jgi:hypothetical protein
MSALPWIAYAVGYFVWLGYAINRFCYCVTNADDVMPQVLLAFLWPGCVAVYLPYRIFRWFGVSR